MKTYHCYINREYAGDIQASTFVLAKLAARVAYGRRVDVVGPR